MEKRADTETPPYGVDLLMMLVAVQLGPVAIVGAFLFAFARHSPTIVRVAKHAATQARAALPLDVDIRAFLPAAETAQDDAQREDAPQRAATLLDAMQDAIHLLVIGYTGGGKTTLMHEVATRWAAGGHKVVVCDPDAAPGMWPNCQVFGYGNDFAAIGKALGALNRVAAKRREDRARGQRTFPPLYFIIDEVQDTVRLVDTSWTTLEDVIRRGRKLNIHIMMGVQDKQVKTLRLEGKSEVVGNLTTVKARRMLGGRRVADVDHHDGEPFQRYPIPALRDPETLIVQRPHHPDTDTLQALLERPIPPAAPDTSTSIAPVSPDMDAANSMVSGTGITAADTSINWAVVDALILAGWSANRIYEYTGGNRNKVLEYVRERRGTGRDDDAPLTFRRVA